ncbi:hypothetical protein D3C81_1791940 [compost metagenome]
MNQDNVYVRIVEDFFFAARLEPQCIDERFEQRAIVVGAKKLDARDTLECFYTS